MNESTLNQPAAVFDLIDRPIWIITARAGDRRGGLLATWVSQASLDPRTPMLAIALARNHFTAALVAESGRFAAHLFEEAFIPRAARFALESGRDTDKFVDEPLVEFPTGSPVLRDCLAWLDCRVVAERIVGDRRHFWGIAEQGGRKETGTAVTERQFFGGLSRDQVKVLREDRERDIETQRRMWAEWLAENA